MVPIHIQATRERVAKALDAHSLALQHLGTSCQPPLLNPVSPICLPCPLQLSLHPHPFPDHNESPHL